MLLDPQVGFRVKQPVEDVGGVSHADADDLETERCVLVRDVGIKELARFGAILGIDVFTEEGEYDKIVADRYAGWQTPEASSMLSGT